MSRLRDLPAERIIRAIGDAAARWCNADYPPRVRATNAVTERLEYSEPVVDYALDRLFGPITARALAGTIAGELGSIAALDGFVPRSGRPAAFARGTDSAVIISSDTTIGVALWPALFALCAKSRVNVKDRSDALIAAFAQTLTEEEPAIGECFGVREWSDREDPELSSRLRAADVVVAFGRDESLRTIRERCGPVARFVAFGHRTSIGYIEAQALDERPLHALARAVALDALLYEGEGCLSLHLLFVERCGELEAFMSALVRAYSDVAIEFPSARRPASFALVPAAFLVRPAFDATPPFAPATIAIYEVGEPEEVARFVDRHAIRLEAVAVADPARARPDVRHFAAGSGASRLARLGTLQSPALEANHGGEGRILPFIRWIGEDAP